MKYRTIAAVLLAFSALQAAGGHIFSTMDANGNEVTSVLNPDGTPVATSNMVEKMIAAMPEPITPDYSTANTQLVATIEAVSPAPGNYAVVSNRAINAVTTNSLGSVTLSQVEDSNAENYDTCTVGHWMGAGYVITHGGDYYIVGYTFQKTALGWDNDVVAGKIHKMGAEGERCVTIGQYTSTAGTGNAVAGRYSFAEGNSTHAEGRYTHAEGAFTHAEGYCTHAEGNSTHAEGYGTHAEGSNTHAEGEYTHAEGLETRAGGTYTHAEGELTDAVGYCTHAEGYSTHAEGYWTHAEGYNTHAKGFSTHAEGVRSEATNDTSFVWQGAAGRSPTDYDPATYPQYGSHGDGTFNINPAPAVGETDVASGFYIGERSLKSRIDDAIAAINKGKQDNLPYPTNAIPQGAVSGLATALATLSNTTATINSKIPSAASASNQLADKEWIDDEIDTYAAYYITYTAAGAAFPTRAALTNATVVYSGGAERTPTRNDYAVVLSDESHGGAEWRYIYTVAAGATSGQWDAQYPIETNDYDGLSNKPQINGVTLSGNKGAEELGLVETAELPVVESNILATAKAYTDAEISGLQRGLVDGVIEVGEATHAYQATDADYAAALLSPDGMYLRNAKDIIIQIDAAIATNARQDAAINGIDVMSGISATNTVFSNAVLSVGLGIDTNTVAAINALVEAGDELPIGGAATVGGLLLALAAAVAALKRTKANVSSLRYSIPNAISSTGTLLDRAVNNVICGDAVIELTLPEAKVGYARDFFVRADRTSSGNLGVTFAMTDAGGEEVSFETENGSKPLIEDGAITTLLFTEVMAGRFMVAEKPAVEVIGGIS